MTPRERLLKRKPRQIEIDGDEFFIRSLTLREGVQVDAIEEGQKKLAYVVAVCMTDADGTPLFSGPEDDSILDIPTDTLREISDRITKMSTAGNAAKLEKN